MSSKKKAKKARKAAVTKNAGMWACANGHWGNKAKARWRGCPECGVPFGSPAVTAKSASLAAVEKAWRTAVDPGEQEHWWRERQRQLGKVA